MNDTIDSCRIEGSICLDGEDIYESKLDVVPLRARVGMVFQNPIPFRKAFTTTSPTARKFTASPAAAPIWTK